jgi:dTDP-4-dehydrorhamnose 3,5-epimerase
MRFRQGPLSGIWIVESEKCTDDRGYFMRAFCAIEFEKHGLPQRFVQASLSSNPRKGTVRGLHFQWPPSKEEKLVRCISGAIYDAVVDLRPSSPTFMQYFAIELSEHNGAGLFVPDGFAHGFQVLEEGTRVLYQMTDVFDPALSGGFAHNDPAFAVQWPHSVTCISERDRTAPAFDAQA